MSARGSFYLIPNSLGADSISDTIPPSLSNFLINTAVIFVEKEKLARRLLIQLGLKEKLDQFELISIKHGIDAEMRKAFQHCVESGKDVALISDAGCPAIADPGHELVSFAHKIGISVRPKTGPSSIILALMASGFNGQNFAFHGYLPKEVNKKIQHIRKLESLAIKEDQTQIFIETPFRNQYLFKDLLSTCQKNTNICLAVNLTFEDEWIKSTTVEQWRRNVPDIHKKQCIFLIYKP
ncbi:MAG: SAM-dependent methyltransferase [Vicingaceae bacterium]